MTAYPIAVSTGKRSRLPACYVSDTRPDITRRYAVTESNKKASKGQG
ncbi:hypothetical protein [Endozoicomonas sp. Mp262]